MLKMQNQEGLSSNRPRMCKGQGERQPSPVPIPETGATSRFLCDRPKCALWIPIDCFPDHLSMMFEGEEKATEEPGSYPEPGAHLRVFV